MRRDHRPYFIKSIFLKYQEIYTNHFLRPQFEYLGRESTVTQPWNIVVFGGPIRFGDFTNLLAAPDKKIRLSVWSKKKDIKGIQFGDFCLVCSGVRVSSASEITIGDNCMLASGAYLTDADWHDIYDRTAFGTSAPIILEDNVWVGDQATVCKGVTIGKNSIIGAGSVVVNDIPANTVAAGNPARVVKELDPNAEFVTRDNFFRPPRGIAKAVKDLDKYILQDNTFLGWLRSLMLPSTNH